MDQTLVNSLAAADKPTETWTSPDGSELLLLPYGARILGLFSPGSARNFLWTHPALREPESAKAFFEAPSWHNTGGDRTWLAPEIDFFFPAFPDLDSYYEPRALDPGDFRTHRQGQNFALYGQCALAHSRLKTMVTLALSKRITPAINPLRELAPHLSEKLHYAGYTLFTQLRFMSGHAEAARAGIWNLLQLPHGGDLLIATRARARVDMFMGEIGPQDLQTTDHLIRYKMRAPGKHKFGIPVATAIGRVGYLHSSAGHTSLVVRSLSLDPAGEYVDVPWGNPAAAGSVVQACNIDDSELGQYSELEYHAPAIGGVGGTSHGEDVSQVWAFSGREEDVVAAARILISAEV
ncbi:MAG: hypothetical protein JST79_09420 [Acidobacteria bacterium]|nr:hypothetical protein [Acidobacteriota bacterium]